MIGPHIFSETLLGFLAPVRPYLDDPSVSEVMINGPDRVYVERRGRLELTRTKFESCEAVLCALRNAAQFVGKRVDERNPILEGRLPDGSRLLAVVPPAGLGGPYVSIRRFSRDTFSVGRLIDLDSLTSDAAQALQAIVRAKLNVMIAGGTGSGKTSLLNVLTNFIPDDDRIVVIEDSKEVQVQRSHVVTLEARPPFPDGGGAVTIRDLFRASLRMRPDRIVIGEIRGGEALEIIQAMVSGHGGCMGTLHATYPRDTLTRLETMSLMSDVEMPLAAVRMQIASAVQVIVQVARLQDGTRKITHISEVRGFDPLAAHYDLEDVFVRDFGGVDDQGRVKSRLRPSGHLPSFLPQLRQHGVDMPSAVHDAARKGDGPR
jgi:pilus assembly protein CpaF